MKIFHTTTSNMIEIAIDDSNLCLRVLLTKYTITHSVWGNGSYSFPILVSTSGFSVRACVFSVQMRVLL